MTVVSVFYTVKRQLRRGRGRKSTIVLLGNLAQLVFWSKKQKSYNEYYQSPFKGFKVADFETIYFMDGPVVYKSDKNKKERVLTN